MIDFESYHDYYTRYLIRGTRSCMTVTVDTRTNTLRRKGRGEKPWITGWFQCQASEILRMIADMKEHAHE